MKSRNLQPRLLYLARLSLKIEGEMKSFLHKKKLSKFVNTKPVLRQMLKGLLEEEKKKEEEEEEEEEQQKIVKK